MDIGEYFVNAKKNGANLCEGQTSRVLFCLLLLCEVKKSRLWKSVGCLVPCYYLVSVCRWKCHTVNSGSRGGGAWKL